PGVLLVVVMTVIVAHRIDTPLSCVAAAHHTPRGYVTPPRRGTRRRRRSRWSRAAPPRPVEDRQRTHRRGFRLLRSPRGRGTRTDAGVAHGIDLHLGRSGRHRTGDGRAVRPRGLDGRRVRR